MDDIIISPFLWLGVAIFFIGVMATVSVMINRKREEELKELERMFPEGHLHGDGVDKISVERVRRTALEREKREHDQQHIPKRSKSGNKSNDPHGDTAWDLENTGRGLYDNSLLGPAADEGSLSRTNPPSRSAKPSIASSRSKGKEKEVDSSYDSEYDAPSRSNASSRSKGKEKEVAASSYDSEYDAPSRSKKK